MASLPPELRVLCNKLSSTATADLPRLTPTLLRHVLRCQSALSNPAANAAKPDSSNAAVLVHKLKTQLSALLNGRSPEGRFAAVVLVKAVVEVGGWEVLRGTELWVRGLISVLGKPDAAATKELSIVALTKIYSMTHPYQTLLREITTPTLPGYITACLNLISSKATTKTLDASEALIESVFRSFAVLLPRHTTLFRPFVNQIRNASRTYLAPTFTDGTYLPVSVIDSARRLVVLLHQTVAKGGGGEEWGKSLRELVKTIHVTADHVFRAVVEDWESSAGYVPESVDVNQVLSGGGQTAEDLPRWEAIDAGVDRLRGLLEFLMVYFETDTSTPVTIPLGIVVDLIVRMLSISNPTPADLSASKGGPRLNPAVDRDERDGLWSGLPQIYIAALNVIQSMAERLGAAFLPLAQGLVMQIAWVYTYGKHVSEFREATYAVIAKLLPHTGQSLAKNQVAKLYGIIRSCCHDVHGLPGVKSVSSATNPQLSESNGNASSQNADSFLRNSLDSPAIPTPVEPALAEAAESLLPLVFSHLPQQQLDITIRALVERTVILTHNKSGMLASVLSPFTGRSGATLPSIVPHLSRAYSQDAVVEILLRPRMPLIPSASSTLNDDSYQQEAVEDEEMGVNVDATPTTRDHSSFDTTIPHADVQSNQLFASTETKSLSATWNLDPRTHNVAPERAANVPPHVSTTLPKAPFPAPVQTQAFQSTTTSVPAQDTEMEEGGSDSSDGESVHLTMQLDSDSEVE